MTLADGDIERILSAAETIEKSLSILAERQSLTRAAYKENTVAQDVVERRFVKLTEAALDIGKTLVVNERGTQPASNPATMRKLVDIGVLDDETAESMAQAARFRNVLAHTYGDVIDHDVVYNALQDLERYREFLIAVRTYLDENDLLEQ